MPSDEIDDFLKAGSKSDEIGSFLRGGSEVPTKENRGGIGQPVSRDEAANIAAQRLVARERAAGFRPGDVMTRDELQKIADQAGIPLESDGYTVGRIASTAQMQDPKLKAAVMAREVASQSAFGVPGAAQRLLEDVTLNEAQKKSFGSQAMKERAPEYAQGGALIGSIAPTKLISTAAKPGLSLGSRMLQGVKTGAGIGATAAGSGAIEEKGLEIDPKEFAIRTALGGGVGTLIGGGIPLASSGFSKASDALRGSAERDVGKALLQGGGTKEQKKIVERITPEILNRPVKDTFAFTKKGLAEKTGKQAEKAGEAIGDYGAIQGTSKIQPFLDNLEKLKTDSNFIVDGKVMNPEAVKNIDAVKDLIGQHGDVIPNAALMKIRKGFDQETYAQKGAFPTYSEKSLLEFKKIASDDIRETLAQKDPDLAKLNKQFNFWSNFNKVAEGTAERTRGHKGFMPFIAALGGGALGNDASSVAVYAASAAALTKAIQSPGWKLASAHTKNAIADFLANPNPKTTSYFAKSLTQIDKDLGAEFMAQMRDLPEPKQKESLSGLEKRMILDRDIKSQGLR